MAAAWDENHQARRLMPRWRRQPSLKACSAVFLAVLFSLVASSGLSDSLSAPAVLLPRCSGLRAASAGAPPR